MRSGDGKDFDLLFYNGDLEISIGTALFFTENSGETGWHLREWHCIWHGIFLVVFIATEIMPTVTTLNYAKDYVPNPKFKIFAGILSGTAYFATAMLGIFIICIKIYGK